MQVTLLKGDSNAQVIMPLDENADDTLELTHYMERYCHGTEGPSDFSHEIYNALYAPLIEATDLGNADDIASLKKQLSRISLVGYSYGGNLVQQIAENMARDLSQKLTGEEDKGIKIYDICRSVKALNIGPVARLNHIEQDGRISQIRHDDPYYSEALTLFSQTSFLMRNDKIVQRTLENELVGDQLKSEIGIEARGTQSSSMFIDYVGRPQHKLIGYQDLNIRAQFAKVATNFDFLLHDMRTYMNVHEAKGALVVFPTLAIAPILRDASAAMLQDGVDGRDWLNSLNQKHATADARKALVQSFDQLDEEFRTVINTYEESTYAEGFEYLKNYVESKVATLNSDKKPLTIPPIRQY